MARDIAEAINNNYGKTLLKLPSPYFSRDMQMVVGLDGRKMSKSYNNVIPLLPVRVILRSWLIVLLQILRL